MANMSSMKTMYGDSMETRPTHCMLAGKHSEVEGGARGSWDLPTPHRWGQRFVAFSCQYSEPQLTGSAFCSRAPGPLICEAAWLDGLLIQCARTVAMKEPWRLTFVRWDQCQCCAIVLRNESMEPVRIMLEIFGNVIMSRRGPLVFFSFGFLAEVWNLQGSGAFSLYCLSWICLEELRSPPVHYNYLCIYIYIVYLFIYIYLYIRFYYHRTRCLVGGWNISPVDNFAHWRGSRKCGAPQRASATPGSLEGGTRHQHLSHAQSWSLPFDMNSWPFRIWFTNIFTSKLEIVCFDRRTIMNHQNLFNIYFLIYYNLWKR